MRKRIKLVNMLALVMFFVLGFFSITYANESDPNGVDKQQAIKDLYKERAELCANFDENVDRIEKIDKQLEKLGVEELSEGEVFEILSEAENFDMASVPSLMIATPSVAGVKWTSSRSVNTYNGIQYEVQELHAIPTSMTSCLYSSHITYSASNRNIRAASNLAKSALPNVLGLVPKIGGDLATGVTIFQLLKGAYTDLQESTIVSNI